MAYEIQCYPKVQLKGTTWRVRVKLSSDTDYAVIEHIETAGIAADCTDQNAGQLLLLKLSFVVVVEDSDTFQDVFDALIVDDIRPGPQTASVWDRWRDRAESILSGMSSPYTRADYWAEWGQNDTAAIRNDARTAIGNRGWTVLPGSVKYMEGDGSVVYE